MKELRALTGARGIAAWLVVLYHIRLSIAGLPPVAERVLAKGYLAVDFFFLLSGFVIWLSWHDQLREKGKLGHFLLKRAARVWPLHALMLTAAASLAVLLVATGHAPASQYRWAELPLHLLLLQDWGWSDPLAWNDPAWSISAEAAAYLLFPLLVAIADWRRLSTPALLAVATLLLVALHLAMRHQPGLGADIARFGVLRCLVEFGTGTLVAALHCRGFGKHAGLLAAASLAAWWLGMPETLAVPLALAAVLLALARSAGKQGHPLEGQVIHRLGEISYATYLSHYVGWQAFKLALVTDASAVPLLLILLYLAAVLAASLILYERFEKPAQRWIEAVPANLRARRARAHGFRVTPARRRTPPPAR